MKNGTVTIQLEKIFLESVTIDDQNPMKVFVTLNADNEGVFVETGTTSFTVKERRGGKSSVSFDYRIIAKRKGLESRRADPFEEDELETE